MRVAVIGLGNAGSTLHLPALAGLPGVTAFGMDIDSSRRAVASARFRIPVYADFDELVDEGRPDVIMIGTPPDSHADYCLRSFAAGAHVICEKPFVASLAEADMVLDAARAAGRRVALNHEFREMPIFRAVRDAVDSGESGKLVFAQVWQLMDLPPWAEPGWRGEMLQRTLYEAGVHLVDFLIALFGEIPVSVEARTSTCGVREGDTDAVALVTLEFPGGRLAQITQNRLCKGETQYFEVRADTEKASIRASFGGRARLLAGLFRSTRPALRFEYGVSGMAWRERAGQREFLARNPKDPGMVATRTVIERTLQAFRDGTEPPASGEVGRDVLAVIAAAYHSAATGTRCQVNAATTAQLRDLRLG
ncbi:MAG: Gfo/Idh/MocA family oxidoreductase [Gemmatimonadales bacterium]|nr:Gfo/Idh/MocA family oxidoreductase [Gemmatimonadales bacterium]